MSSIVFMFMQLWALGAASSLASLSQLPPLQDKQLQADKSVLADLGLDETLWDAFAEAALAIIVFAVTSVVLKAYRTRTSKNRPQKFASKAPISTNSGRQVSVAAMQKAQRRGVVGVRHEAEEIASCVVRSSEAHSQVSGSSLGKGANAMAAAPWKRQSSGIERVRVHAELSETDVIANAVRAGNASQLPEILDAAYARAISAAARQTPPVSKEDVAAQLVLAALRSCASARLFKDAVAAYDYMAERIGEGNAHLWSVLLYNAVEAEAFVRGRDILERLARHSCPSGHDFVNMARCFVGLQDAAGLKEALAKLASFGHSVDTYSLNRALAACGASECALDLADVLVASQICAEGLDAVGYNTLMKCNARAGRLSRCFELREEMVAKGLEASEVTFGILLDACVNAQDLDRARKIFEDVCNSGFQLNVVICTTLIKGLVSAGRLDEAAGVLREMKTSAGVKPDLIAYSTVVKAYADSGNVVVAMKMLQQMLQEGVRPDEIVFNGVLSGCCAFPMKPAAVVDNFETLISHGLKPSTTTLSILLKALMLTDAWSTGLQILKDAPKRFGLLPEMRLFAQLAQACVKARMGRAVVEVVDDMLAASSRQGKRADPAAFGRIIRSCLMGSDYSLASELRDTVLRAGLALDPQTEKMFLTAAKWNRGGRPNARNSA